jgi:hypothetical protein
MVPNSRTPFRHRLHNPLQRQLQVVISFQLEVTPTRGFSQSSSPVPAARSMPRAAARSMRP